jgi:hypothetical protein
VAEKGMFKANKQRTTMQVLELVLRSKGIALLLKLRIHFQIQEILARSPPFLILRLCKLDIFLRWNGSFI